jgi:hypothetical protein
MCVWTDKVYTLLIGYHTTVTIIVIRKSTHSVFFYNKYVYTCRTRERRENRMMLYFIDGYQPGVYISMDRYKILRTRI